MHSIALYLYKYIRPVLIVALLISLGFSKGSISGKVKFLGKPVANATVELFLYGDLVMEKKTNSRGIFVFWNIKNGYYDLKIRRSGYNVLWKRNIRIKGTLIPTEIEFPDLNLTFKKKPDWQKQRQKYKPKYNNDRKPEIVGEIKDKIKKVFPKIKKQPSSKPKPVPKNNFSRKKQPNGVAESAGFFVLFILSFYFLFIRKKSKSKKVVSKELIAEVEKEIAKESSIAKSVEPNKIIEKNKNSELVKTKNKKRIVKVPIDPYPDIYKTKKTKTLSTKTKKTSKPPKKVATKKPINLNGMDYGQWINLTLNKFMSLPHNLRKELWKELERGTKVIETRDQLDAYMSSYGFVHEARFRYCFNRFCEILPSNKNKKYMIIDWGCGQGIGSYILLEMLGMKYSNIYSLNTLLVDLSQPALNRARRKIKIDAGEKIGVYTKNINLMRSVNSRSIFNNIRKHSFDKKTVKVHIMANLLDMDGVRFKSISKSIYSNSKGENYFICVSPSSVKGTVGGIDSFVNYLNKKYRNKIEIKYQSNFSVPNVRFHDIFTNTKKKIPTNGYLAIIKLDI